MKKEIRRKLRELGVSTVYLFGSRASQRQSRLSDLDIGVVLKKPPLKGDTRSTYDRLYRLLTEVYPASKLDIVFLQTAPVALQYSAVKTGKILFEEDPVFTADYEYSVINQYLDFRPVLDRFDQVAMERYAKT